VKPEAFARALRVDVPLKMKTSAQRIFFDVSSALHEAIVVGPPATPVDTGYLRASLAFTVGSEVPPEFEKRTRTGTWITIIPSPAIALARAVESFLPFTIGFRADYATYVEDDVGMVKTAHARAGQFVRQAIRNAQSARRSS
jgi:hypothetical protein